MKLSRFAALLATALIAWLAVPAPAQAAPIPFYADSGDQCVYGLTRGTVQWRSTGTPPSVHSAAISGSLADRPIPTDPVNCRDDGYFSVATFVAYAGNLAVDRDARRVNNGVVQFDIVLGVNATPTPARIDRVVIQVCRHTNSTVAPVYCGLPVRVPAP